MILQVQKRCNALLSCGGMIQSNINIAENSLMVSRGSTLKGNRGKVRQNRVKWRRVVQVENLFTGIVQGKAVVKRIDRKGNEFQSLDVEFPGCSIDGVQIGGSVAINGTCLTVVGTRPEEKVARFDVIEETLRRTNLGELIENSNVNFERSAKMGDEIGGHTVSGHVHTIARVVSVEKTEDNVKMEFKLDDISWAKYILPKGFIAVDGCSLTVGNVSYADGVFCVYLIPETLRMTVLGEKEIGDAVNIEIEAQTQAIVDTVERVVARYMAGGKSQVM
eukprot:jgi/Picsp_1/5942/NSC_03299-R1_riboflavin synthase subunit alpha